MIDKDFSTYFNLQMANNKAVQTMYILWVLIFGPAIVKCEEAIRCISNETNVSATLLSLMLKNFLSIRLL